MAINRVEIKDFLVFQGEFTANFCSGINILIGGNATGKTTLLKCLYYGADRFTKPKKFPEILQKYFGIAEDYDTVGETHDEIQKKFGMITMDVDGERFEFSYSYFMQPHSGTTTIKPVYIPEKDILEHAKGLLTFIEQKQTGFSQIYKDVLVKAQDIPTQKQSKMQQKVGKLIVDTIGGDVRWDKGDGSFYTFRTDGTRIPFTNEASGYKKLGFLGLLVTSGQLENDSVLFWDEPENSINPELLPVLVDILLELQRGGVQVFIATHSEIFSSYFNVLCTNDDKIMFYSLYKENGHIKFDKSERFDLLTPNKLTEEPVKLYERELDKGLGNV
jgi:AAA15 family ATPase/GTPase